MKKLDTNQKICIISFIVFIIFLVGYFVWVDLVEYGILPDQPLSQSLQGILVFIMFLPIFVSLFFLGRYFKAKSNADVGKVLTFVSIALFVFGAIQMLLSLLGVYGA